MTITDTVTRGPVKKDRPAPVTRTVTRRSTSGADLGSVDLEPSIFGIEPNVAVMHQVVTAQLAAIRSGTQSTKTRAQVRGGGAKPFAQKGTGRARQGSSRSPSMSGGGVALGPKPRSYRQHTPKTKDALHALSSLNITGSVLVVLADDETVAGRSFANLPGARTTSYGQLSAHDVLRHDWILFSDRTLPGATDATTVVASASAEPETVTTEAGTNEAGTDETDETEEAATDA